MAEEAGAVADVVRHRLMIHFDRLRWEHSYPVERKIQVVESHPEPLRPEFLEPVESQIGKK
jgi:hypothetical protein